MTRLNSSLLLALSLTLALPVSGQQIDPGRRRGLASSLANGLSLKNTPYRGAEATRVKPPLDQSAPPPAWSSLLFLHGPNYSLEAMFGTLVASAIEIDAHSTGNDIIPKGFNGTPFLNGRWMEVVVSYSDGAQGEEDSLLEAVRLAGSPGADLFSYYFKESGVIETSLRGTTMIEQTRASFGFGSADDADIDAVDFGLGVNAHAQGTPSLLLFTETNEYYFSLHPSCIDLVNIFSGSGRFADEKGPSGQPVPVVADAATVYRIKWSGTAWSRPWVYASAATLGLNPAAPDNDDLDALAVDPRRKTLVFSTQLDGSESQLKMYEEGVGVSPLRSSVEGEVSKRLGGADDTDNIDGLCILDPTEPAGVASHCATPTGLGIVGFDPTGISITRLGTTVENGDDELLIQVTGWGQAMPTAGSVLFYISFDYDPNSSTNVWFPAGSVSRSSTQDAVNHSLTITGTSKSVAMTALILNQGGDLIGATWVTQFQVN